jgi:hypothetical protein
MVNRAMVGTWGYNTILPNPQKLTSQNSMLNNMRIDPIIDFNESLN